MFKTGEFLKLKKLIIAPHVDDEVLGLGGIIDSNTHVLHLGLASDQKHGNNFFTREDRISEWNLVQNETKCSHELLNHPVNSYILDNLIPDIEKSINEFKPSIIFIPNPSYNQDHQVSYLASLVALRPHDINHYVPVILSYYQPQDLWAAREKIDPNFFIKVDINKHIKLYKFLNSQIREHRSFELIKSQTLLFGSLANCKNALGFKSHRFTLNFS